MNEGLDLVGEMLVLVGQGHAHLQREFEGEGLPLAVDGAQGDGSLEAVGLTHGEAPYWHYGGSSCVFFVDPPGKVIPLSPDRCRTVLSYPLQFPPHRAPTGER
jgi:hypothetical protein